MMGQLHSTSLLISVTTDRPVGVFDTTTNMAMIGIATNVAAGKINFMCYSLINRLATVVTLVYAHGMILGF